jgi:hypothetical protein
MNKASRIAALRPLPIVAALLLGVAGLFALAADDEPRRIAAVMQAQFDQPDRSLHVDPVSVESGFAVAGWRQGDLGGRALLQRQGAQWQIVLCAGDALLQAATLTGAGMNDAAALRLLARMRAAEARLTPEHRAALAKFGGITRLQHGHH